MALPEAPQDRLLGLPIFYSTNVPYDSVSGETEIYVLDGRSLMVAFWQEIDLDASQDATLWDVVNSRAISAFQRNQTLLRSILRTDIGVRHPEAISVIRNVVV